MSKAIDLNCDMGEGVGNDAALMEFVTSANIACGGHTGDESTMRAAVQQAAERGLAIGAHPSYPDRPGFGRIPMTIEASKLKSCIAAQIEHLVKIASQCHAAVTHVKPHGALYHAAMNDPELAAVIESAVREIDPALLLVGLAGAPGLEWWRAKGMRVAAEAFADRRYEANGSLRGRQLPNAMITHASAAAEQAVRIAQGRGVLSVDGQSVHVSADTICIHSDSAGAVETARAVRAALNREAINLRPLSRIRNDPGALGSSA